MRLSKDIKAVFEKPVDAELTVRDIRDRVSVKGFGMLILILSLPSALPLPAPGYSVPFGIALLLLGVQMVLLRKTPWFPERVLRREVGIRADSKLIGNMVWFLGLFEKIIRPRWRSMYTNKLTYRAMGLMVCLCALSMCIPIPLTNTGPALGIFLIGLGAMEEDGLSGIAGLIVGMAGILLTLTILTLIVFFGMEAVDMVKDFIKSLLGAG
jgi:hypothetical protein